MNYLKSIGVLLILCLLVSCKSKNKEQSKEKPPALVDIMIAGNEDFSSSLEVNGTVLSNEQVELHPEVSGRLVYLNVPDGGSVSEGTVLAKINDADLQAQKEQLKTQLDLANKTEKRLGDLLKVNGVNQADYDVALNQVNTLQANIKIVDAQLDKTVIRAPFSGQLGIREVSPGAYVTPQTLIGTLQQTDRVKIDFTVPETNASLVHKGNKVRVQTNTSDENLTATIAAVEPQINSVTRNIKVRAFLNNGSILPGAFVKILLDQNRQVIVVPTNAIIPDALSNQVVVIHGNKAVFTNVETGTRNANLVELSKGINVGDSVVVSGMLFVRPNAEVKIKKVVESAIKKTNN
jgi:membrane fusion protein, multidrug efflux system